MATRYIGDAVVRIAYRDRGDYAGSICAGKKCWRFSELNPAPAGFGSSAAYDSPEAYDSMAASAASFGSYFTTHNRGRDTPDWAPSAEAADAIDEATSWAMDPGGSYEVRRSRMGPPVRTANPTRTTRTVTTSKTTVRTANPYARLLNPWAR